MEMLLESKNAVIYGAGIGDEGGRSLRTRTNTSAAEAPDRRLIKRTRGCK
jgi:hypothetical protein